MTFGIRRFFTMAVFATVLVCAMSVGAGDGAGNPAAVKGGTLSRKGDFYVLHLKGTWREMGKAHGELLRDQIRHNTAELWETRIIPQIGKVPATLLRNQTLNLRPMLPPEVKEELEGIAEGSGVPIEDLQVACLLGGAWQFMAGRQEDAGMGNPIRPNECSSFAAFGKATKDGHLIYAHNFDWVKELGLQDCPLVAAYEPENGQRFVTLGWAGVLYVITGLNESGVTVGCIGATSAAEKPYGLPMGLIIRKVLQNAHDMSEAEQLVGGSRRICGFNYVLGWGRGPDARVFETNAEAIAVFRPNQKSEEDPPWMMRVPDALFRADCAMNPKIRERQTCDRGKPKEPGIEPPFGSGSYETRYKVVGQMIENNLGKVDLDMGVKIMQAAAMVNANMQSYVCDSTRMVFRVAVAKGDVSAHTREYVEFNFADLFDDKKAK
ncbi:MAG TPA: C45 family autoproteolytic acyltransferase/hydrolase [Candidatus Brocadiia bacterium]|nr:C45 family autoproteolytic acyltransferase/hydrolase [Candidatus Brocadiia bacterium]